MIVRQRRIQAVGCARAAGMKDLATAPGRLIVLLFSLNSTNLGFVTESFEEAELVTDAILGEIDIPCPP